MSSQELQDRQDLQDLMVRYAMGIDERDYDSYRACFASDVEFTDFTSEPIVGIEPWVEYVQGVLDPYRATQHMLGPQWAVVDGDRAHARTDLQTQHWRKDPDGACLTLWGTYQTDAVRIDGEWKIQRHRLVTRATQLTGMPD